jgi:hypothetical protein
MALPSWILLLWCGLAATCAAALLGTLLGGSAPASWALVPRARSVTLSVLSTIVAGVLLYPVFYGIAFEALARSSAGTGFALGSAHAVLVLALRWRSAGPRAAARNAAMHLLYGGVIAFLYVTP